VDPNTEEQRQEDCKLKVSLGYIVRPYHKTKQYCLKIMKSGRQAKETCHLHNHERSFSVQVQTGLLVLQREWYQSGWGGSSLKKIPSRTWVPSDHHEWYKQISPNFPPFSVRCWVWDFRGPIRKSTFIHLILFIVHSDTGSFALILCNLWVEQSLSIWMACNSDSNRQYGGPSVLYRCLRSPRD
jgi:hypothetical protein